jgi:EAL domain-containing protein (putative c-di-GMP-specific phosphodiesterase class I)
MSKGLTMSKGASVRTVVTHRSLSERLRRAADERQWALHYQPVVDLEQADVIGVEALIRWQDPVVGLIPPVDFLPLAEEMGLINAIGDWVFEEACRQSVAWREEGIDLEIALNLSPRQLSQPDLAEKVSAILAASSTTPSQIAVEITESAAMEDLERTSPVLWDLQKLGLRLAMDDFGTGYSSLSRLKHLPFHTLKIDRSFIRDIPRDPSSCGMVTAIMQLAHSLGMQSLAEGIETRDQWRFLADNFLTDAGYPQGQGFFFSRPVPASKIGVMLTSGLSMTDDVTP